ncbi:MAG TPA: flavin reductase family protein [Thermomicrobiales bacterium]
MDTEAPTGEPALLIDRAMMVRMRQTDPADERATFIEAMSRAAAGVTVVATAGDLGRFGQTVSAMCSVSADPPLLLVCINRKSACGEAIARHRVFSVNVLRADQQRVSQVFAGRPRTGEAYDFDCAIWEVATTGSPLLVGAVARFDCALETVHDAATHRIFVGRVVASDSAQGTPLVYSQRGYGELLMFPRHRADGRPVPAGFVGDEPSEAFEDLWDTEVWE